MGTIFFVFCILALFAFYDVVFRVRMIMGIRGARRFVDRAAPRIARIIFAAGRMAVGIRVERERPAQPVLPDRFLVVSNHQSLIDIPVLIYCLSSYRLRFVGKKELFRFILMISVMFRLLRHACIDRHRDFARTTRELERLGRRSAREGTCVAVFPEGTRSRTGRLLPFHAGAVRTILRAHPAPVVAVALDGGYRTAKLRDVLHNLPSLRYRFKVVSTYPAPHDKEAIQHLLADARVRIDAQITEWRRPERPTAAAR